MRPSRLRGRCGFLRRRSRQLSRKRKGSGNHAKAACRLARRYSRVRCIRRDFLHELTTWLLNAKPAIVAEGLSVRGLGRGRLSRSVADAGWGGFRLSLSCRVFRCAQ